MQTVFIVLYFIFMGLLFVGLFINSLNLKRNRERGFHHKKVIDGFYNHRLGYLNGFVEKDESIPEEFEDLRVVRPIERNLFLPMSKYHILDQELYDKLMFYADTFDGVDFRAMNQFEKESFERHHEWKSKWRIDRFMGFFYPTFSYEEHQEKQRGIN